MLVFNDPPLSGRPAIEQGSDKKVLRESPSGIGVKVPCTLGTRLRPHSKDDTQHRDGYTRRASSSFSTSVDWADVHRLAVLHAPPGKQDEPKVRHRMITLPVLLQ